MMSTGELHLSDGQLVRALDADGSEPERRAWERHLARCGRCARALDEIREESDLVSAWLRRAAFEETSAPAPALPFPAQSDADGRLRPRHRTRAAPWLRAAAILVLLAAPVAAIPAARSWIVRQVAGTGDPAPTAAPAAAPAVRPDRPTVLRFVPAAGALTVRFERGASGALALEPAGGVEAELHGVGGANEATISASRVRILDAAGRFRLRVPDAVTTVRVVTPGRTVTVSAAEIGAGAIIRLDGD
jgi:anti-sigma factor RsiW